MAQLVERSLPTPVIRGSNLVIGRQLYLLATVLNKIDRKDKNKEKEAGNGFIFNKNTLKVTRS